MRQRVADVVARRPRLAEPEGGAFGADGALVRAAQAGDSAAFGELYERHRDSIYRYCLSRTGSTHDAEDLTGDVFVKALQSLDRYHDRGLPFVAFLYRIARNAAIDRSRTLKQPLSMDLLLTDPASGHNVEAEATLAVERGVLMVALTRLKPEHREVIAMRFIEGYSAVEVAAILGKTEGGVRTLQHRALQRLRKAFEEAERSASRRRHTV